MYVRHSGRQNKICINMRGNYIKKGEISNKDGWVSKKKKDHIQHNPLSPQAMKYLWVSIDPSLSVFTVSKWNRQTALLQFPVKVAGVLLSVGMVKNWEWNWENDGANSAWTLFFFNGSTQNRHDGLQIKVLHWGVMTTAVQSCSSNVTRFVIYCFPR